MSSDRSTERAQRIREAFHRIISLDSAAQHDCLIRLRAAEPEVYSEVLSLLTADSDAGSLLMALEPSLGELDSLQRDPFQLVGKFVSHYEVQEWLGGGGMGVVYRAYDVRLRRRVALKFLPPHMGADSHAKAQFMREARAASALDHPNIGYVHDIDETAAGQLFLAMAFYEGETLKQRIERGAISMAEAIDLGCQIAEGLQAAHRAGIVHRDVKPANVLIKSNGRVKLIDFGISVVNGEEHHAANLVGTAAYMSPEQAAGKSVDHRSDLWSLGVILYEMLSGEKPYKGSSHHEILAAIMQDDPVPLKEVCTRCSPRLSRIISKALSRDPDARHTSAESFREELGMCGTRDTSNGKRAFLLGTGALMITGLVIGLLQGTE
jgi:serine/threonine protein kinase